MDASHGCHWKYLGGGNNIMVGKDKKEKKCDALFLDPNLLFLNPNIKIDISSLYEVKLPKFLKI